MSTTTTDPLDIERITTRKRFHHADLADKFQDLGDVENSYWSLGASHVWTEVSTWEEILHPTVEDRDRLIRTREFIPGCVLENTQAARRMARHEDPINEAYYEGKARTWVDVAEHLDAAIAALTA